MSNPQLVKVFLASSITELKNERQELSALDEDISNLLSHDEIKVEIVKCENLHAGNVDTHDKERIKQKLRECDISLFVFKATVGEWTRQEYAVARELQKEKKHRIFVCFLSVPDEEKTPSLKDFQQQLERDGVFWKECNTPSKVKYEFSIGILTHLGINVGDHAPETEITATIWKTEKLFKQYVQVAAQQRQRQQQIHQAIDNLLAQILAIRDDESQFTSTRFFEVMDFFKEADRWASKTDYDKKKYDDLLFDYAEFLDDYGRYNDAQTDHLSQILLAEDLYDKEQENNAASYNNIGVVHKKQGNYPKALEHYCRALAIREKTLGKEHPNTAASYYNIGCMYYQWKKYPEALKYLEKALEIFKAKLGEKHFYTKKTQEWIDRTKVADEEKDPNLKDFQQQLEHDGVYWKNRNTSSEVKYESSMGITDGGHAPEAKAARNADELFEQYEQEVAKLLQSTHQAIDDLRAKIPNILADESQLISARIVEVMGLYQKADSWASKTEYDKEKYSHLLFDYAQFLYKYGMYYDAEAVWLRQIPLAEELYGQEHENTATSYNEIGLVYDDQGDYSKALEYYKKALAIYKKVLGKDHPNTATTYNNIGTVYDDQGDYPKALEYFEKALAIREKVLGKDHPNTATTYNNIGAVYHKQGDYPKALEYYGKALAIDEKVLGKDHPGTATDYNNIGGVYYDQGDYPKALEYYGKALAIDEKVLGKDHPGTAYDYNNIGSMYYQQKKYTLALEYLEKALKIRKAKLGDDHPNTKGTQDWIEDTLAAMGKKPSFWQRLKKWL